MAATPPTPSMSFIPSEDIELSQEERITLAHARWNEASAANENPSQAKIARQYGISTSTLWDRINGRKTAAARNQQFQRLSQEEEEAICAWILRLQTWGWPPRVEQVRSIAKELLIKKGDDKPVGSLRVRQLKQEQKQLIVKLRVRQLKQEQKQEQKQRNNVISTTDQSGRGMRIRRAPKRFY